MSDGRISILDCVWTVAILEIVFRFAVPSAFGQIEIRTSPSKNEPVSQSEAPSPLSAPEHPWGRFQPSSWCRTQTITWTQHDGKRVRNVNETKTVLESVERNGLTLKETASVDAGGKWIETAPVMKRFDFFGEPIREGTLVSRGEPEKLIVDSLIVPCEKRIYESTTSTGREKTTIWYSTQIYPYVFRVEKILRAAPGKGGREDAILSRSTTEVLESSAFQIRKSKSGTYKTRKIRKSGNMTTVTETSCSRHVPGGVLRETLRELDGDGKEIRTVETRIINYQYTTSTGETDAVLRNPSSETLNFPKTDRPRRRGTPPESERAIRRCDHP